jgi:hypothetical protein
VPLDPDPRSAATAEVDVAVVEAVPLVLVMASVLLLFVEKETVCFAEEL